MSRVAARTRQPGIFDNRDTTSFPTRPVEPVTRTIFSSADAETDMPRARVCVMGRERGARERRAEATPRGVRRWNALRASAMGIVNGATSDETIFNNDEAWLW